MKIQTKYSLMTVILIAAVVASMATLVTQIQRTTLQDEAKERLNAIMSGVTRLAQESLAGHDELMLISYLMFLQRERPELAFASVTHRDHTSRVGSEQPNLLILTQTVSAKDLPVTAYTGPNRGKAIATSAAKASPNMAREASNRVQEKRLPQTIEIKLGFLKDKLDADLIRALRPLVHRTIAVAVLFMALGMLGAATISRLLTRPITALTSAVMAVSQGNLDVSVPVAGRDEVGTLAQRFNAMTLRLKEFAQFREDILHTLTHEINTPLSGLKGYLELWQDRKLLENENERREILGIMLAAVMRMENSLGNALRLFKAPSPETLSEPRKVVWVETIFNEMRTLFAPVARSKRITLHPLPKEAVGFLHVEEEPLRQIITNLISNALKYTPEGGEVRLGLKDSPQELRFWVSDTGYGIPAEDIPHLFTEFYRSRSGGEGAKRIPGSGLGLHITKKAVESMGGQVRLESEIGKGSTFYVAIPKTPPQSQEKP